MGNKKGALVLVAVCIACAGFLVGSAVGQEKSPVPVACVLPQTGSAATWGILGAQGVKLGVEQINAAGGLLGRKLELTVLDSQGNPPVSVAAMRKAVALDAYFVVGTHTSATTIVNMEVLEKAGIPQFCGSISPKITQVGNKNIFRTTPNTNQTAAKARYWITDVIKSKKLAIIYLADEHGKAYTASLENTLKGTKTEVIEKISTEPGQVDYTAELMKIQKSGADTVYVVFFTEEFVRFLLQADKLGLTKKVRIIDKEEAVDLTSVKLAGRAIEGCSSVMSESHIDPLWWPMAVAHKVRFGVFPNHDGVKAYLGLMAAVTATEAIGEFDRKKMKDFLHGRTLWRDECRWMPVSIHYDENGDIDKESYEIMIKNGEQVISNILPPTNLEWFERGSKRCR